MLRRPSAVLQRTSAMSKRQSNDNHLETANGGVGASAAEPVIACACAADIAESTIAGEGTGDIVEPADAGEGALAIVDLPNATGHANGVATYSSGEDVD